MIATRRLAWSLGVCSALISLNLPASAGPAEIGGRAAAEPHAPADAALLEHSVGIDLRGLAEAGPVEIHAVFTFDNRGPDGAPLVFHADLDAATAFQATIDDRPVAPTAAPEGLVVRDDWRPPSTTPGLAGGEPIPYSAGRDEAAGRALLAVPLPAGRHTLDVRYRAPAQKNLAGDPTVYWQFAYALAPARGWASRPEIRVGLTLPDGWAAAVAPAGLTASPGRFEGTVDAAAVAAVAVTAQYVAGPNHDRVRDAGRVLLGLVLLGGPIAFVAVGSGLARRGRPALWYATVGGLAWALSLALSGVMAVIAPDWTLPEAQVEHFGYSHNMTIVVIVGSAIHLAVVGAALCLISAHLTRRRRGAGA